MFLAQGIQRDGGFPPRNVIYLERVGPASTADERHHFRFALDPRRGVADVVMFDRQGVQLFDFVTQRYTCEGQRLGYGGEITGGSEGCLRQGRFRSTVHRDQSGSLVFTYEEEIKYGFFCFKQPAHTVRTTVFPAYAPQQ